MKFKLAHITDVHMGPLPVFGPKYWNVKRALGVANWQRGRKTAHLPATFAALVEDMMAQDPDHIALTGDLVNIGLPAEHITALDWLQKMGGPDFISVVPGNHDIYTVLRDDPGAMRWRAYMSGGGEDASGFDVPPSSRAPSPRKDAQSVQGVQFPYLRRFGNIALIGLNSAIATKPFKADGRLGAAQRQRLAQVLRWTADEGLIRVVMIHHPPLPGQAPRSRALQDAEQMAQILARHGAQLVLHGHNHENMFQWLERSSHGDQPASDSNLVSVSDPKSKSKPISVSALPPVPVIGAPSASMSRHHHGEPLARYNLYIISQDETGVQIELIGRGLAQPGGKIVELERRQIEPARVIAPQ